MTTTVEERKVEGLHKDNWTTKFLTAVYEIPGVLFFQALLAY